jgi:hypothetical protein
LEKLGDSKQKVWKDLEKAWKKLGKVWKKFGAERAHRLFINKIT